ncbi:MAG TPA: hypothetical protein VEV18_07850, partial [Steroidobacteraceae bacterium]|nr:hypothetical protein [Steroidobacteraceae bacterium]
MSTRILARGRARPYGVFSCAIVVGVGCLSFALAAPAALAQQAPDTAVTAQPSDRLQEVVVSARRRNENLQTTPIAITALTGQALEARNLDNVTDVGA